MTLGHFILLNLSTIVDFWYLSTRKAVLCQLLIHTIELNMLGFDSSSLALFQVKKLHSFYCNFFLQYSTMGAEIPL